MRRPGMPGRPRAKPTHKRRFLIVITLIVGANAAGQELPNLVSTVIRGSSVYSASDLFPVYGSYLGAPITSESARSIAAGIADKYAGDGYSRPGVRIDDRMVRVGVLSMEVIETRISAVEISGNPGPYEARLRDLGERLRDDPLLRSIDLQSTVRRMQALSGLTLTASTKPEGTVPGTYRLNVDTAFRAFSGAVRLTNRGTDEIGPQFLLGQATANGILHGRADVGLTFATASDFDEYHGLGLNGRMAVTDDGMAIAVAGFRSRSDPRESPIDRDDRYLRDRLTAGIANPIRNEANRQLALTAGLEASDLEILRSRSALRDERLRLADFGMRWTQRLRPTSQFAASFELTKGINGMGSGLRADDLENDPRSADFSRLVLDFVRVSELSSRWSWRLNSLGQYSGASLPYSERFKIGGDRLGRGFEVAEIAGDRGIGAKIELIRRLPGIPDVAGPVSVYSFYDLAAAWKNDRPGRESAASAGFGLALRGSKTSGRIEIAKPLTHPDVEGRDDLRVFAELTMGW